LLTARDQLVTCHRDLMGPGNVLVDGSGDLVLLDRDDAGPACPGQEFAGLLAFWPVRRHRASLSCPQAGPDGGDRRRWSRNDG